MARRRCLLPSTHTGEVLGQCAKRHRHNEWLKFLWLINKHTPPDKEIHIICDNYATHKHPKVKSWLKYHKRFHVRFTPRTRDLREAKMLLSLLAEQRMPRDEKPIADVT